MRVTAYLRRVFLRCVGICKEGSPQKKWREIENKQLLLTPSDDPFHGGAVPLSAGTSTPTTTTMVIDMTSQVMSSTKLMTAVM